MNQRLSSQQLLCKTLGPLQVQGPPTLPKRSRCWSHVATPKPP